MSCNLCPDTERCFLTKLEEFQRRLFHFHALRTELIDLNVLSVFSVIDGVHSNPIVSLNMTVVCIDLSGVDKDVVRSCLTPFPEEIPEINIKVLNDEEIWNEGVV